MEEVKIEDVAEEIKNASVEELEKTIADWFEKTRTQGMKIGAKYMAAGVFSTIKLNLNKAKPSLRDYERCITDIKKLISVQLTQQNDSESDIVEDSEDDRTAE